MSKTHPLVDIVLNLRSLADNFQALADIVTENEPAAAANLLAGINDEHFRLSVRHRVAERLAQTPTISAA